MIHLRGLKNKKINKKKYTRMKDADSEPGVKGGRGDREKKGSNITTDRLYR